LLLADETGFRSIQFTTDQKSYFKHLQDFITLAETQTGKKVRVIWLDNTSEYKSKKLRGWAAEKGIILQFTTTYTHQQVGVAERSNQTILNAVRSIFDDSRLLLEYWEFAAAYHIYTWNRTWSPTLEKTSYEEWFKREPHVLDFKVFDSVAYVHNPTEPDDQHKLLPTAWKGIFVRFGGLGYKVWDLINKKIIVSRHVKVKENEFGSD
jgi:hypothetical protein